VAIKKHNGHRRRKTPENEDSGVCYIMYGSGTYSDIGSAFITFFNQYNYPVASYCNIFPSDSQSCRAFEQFSHKRRNNFSLRQSGFA
jgi:hypothetical protein